MSKKSTSVTAAQLKKQPPQQWEPIVDAWSAELASATGCISDYNLTKQRDPGKFQSHLKHYGAVLWPIIVEDAKRFLPGISYATGPKANVQKITNKPPEFWAGYLLHRWSFLSVWRESLKLGQSSNAIPTMADSLRRNIELLYEGDLANDKDLFEQIVYFRTRKKPAKRLIDTKLFVLRFWMVWGFWHMSHTGRATTLSHRLGGEVSPDERTIRRVVNSCGLLP
jgi:hypothetical protein